MVEVAEGDEEGTLLDLGLLEVLLFECLLVQSSLGLVLAEGVLPLALAPTRVVFARASLRLALLGKMATKWSRLPQLKHPSFDAPRRQLWRLLWNNVN
jgi:hypothetical protein